MSQTRFTECDQSALHASPLVSHTWKSAYLLLCVRESSHVRSTTEGLPGGRSRAVGGHPPMYLSTCAAPQQE